MLKNCLPFVDASTFEFQPHFVFRKEANQSHNIQQTTERNLKLLNENKETTLISQICGFQIFNEGVRLPASSCFLASCY